MFCSHIWKCLNSSNKYYQNNKGRLQKMSRGKYRSFSEVDKIKTRQYGHKRYTSLSGDEKERLFEYRKRVCVM